MPSGKFEARISALEHRSDAPETHEARLARLSSTPMAELSPDEQRDVLRRIAFYRHMRGLGPL